MNLWLLARKSRAMVRRNVCGAELGRQRGELSSRRPCRCPFATASMHCSLDALLPRSQSGTRPSSNVHDLLMLVQDAEQWSVVRRRCCQN